MKMRAQEKIVSTPDRLKGNLKGRGLVPWLIFGVLRGAYWVAVRKLKYTCAVSEL